MTIDTSMIIYNGSSINWYLFTIGTTISVVCLLSVCVGSIQLEHSMDYFSRAKQSAYSLLLLSIVYFQYFGIFVMFLMLIDNTYFIFYIISSLGLITMAATTFKCAFLIHLERHAALNNLQNRGLSSPRGRFVATAITLMITNYLVSALTIRYTSYAVYVTILSLFPLIAIIENCFRRSRRSFYR